MLLFLTHTYPTAVLSGLRIVAIFNELSFYKKRTMRTIQPRNFHTSPLFKKNSILKFQDKICLENILFVSKSLNNLTPSVFSTDQHNYEISSSTQGNLTKIFYETNIYGKYSIIVSANESWNKILKQLCYIT